MNITKRNGTKERYSSEKITNAIRKAFISAEKEVGVTKQATAASDAAHKDGHEIVRNGAAIQKTAVDENGGRLADEALERVLLEITNAVEIEIKALSTPVTVEAVQDIVERVLMAKGFYKQSKSYILYRNERARLRDCRTRVIAEFPKELRGELEACMLCAEKDFLGAEYNAERLQEKFLSLVRPDGGAEEGLMTLIKSAAELTSQQAPHWEFIAARLLMFKFNTELRPVMTEKGVTGFYDKVKLLTDMGLYGAYILKEYTPAELEEAEKFMDIARDGLLTYSGLELLLKRYVIRGRDNRPLETPQEMFLGIALHLAMPEKKDRLGWVKRFYDMLSLLKVSMATPTMSNARKPFHQLSSCFVDAVPDSLKGIYRSVDSFAQVSKYGGGMGMYFGKVRAKGSAIRGFDGAAGGVIRWIRLVNATAVAVDQLGVRQGAVAVYLDAWHKDLPEFLALRTNNGDDRLKAHDVFPAICCPDLFWKTARDNIESNWYLMCPHDILAVKGYALEDCFGEEWERKYRECVADPAVPKRAIPIKEVVRLIIKSAAETGTPFIFNRDTVNRANPNGHRGMIYCSNLCAEIAQNISPSETVRQSVETAVDGGDERVVTVVEPGDFAVCNLASLTLGKIDLSPESNELESLTRTAMRALDNVIDLNFYPVPYARITAGRYRPVGLGVSGYHHMLAKNKIRWDGAEHIAFADKLFERISFAAVSASAENAEEKGSYSYFAGSDFENGAYFTKRGYTDGKWTALAERVKKSGVRNGYMLAVAPTSSTSIITGTTAGIDPIMNRYFLEEKKSGLIPRVAPELSEDTYWYYKSAYHVDQHFSIRACGARQRHIDQSQSMNLYITNDFTFRQILDLYISAFENGVKTVYYVRGKSLETEECEACSA